MYLGAAQEQSEEEHRANPTVVDIGFPPVRITIPVTSPERKKEAFRTGVGMVAVAGVVLWVGSSYIEKLIRILRG